MNAAPSVLLSQPCNTPTVAIIGGDITVLNNSTV